MAPPPIKSSPPYSGHPKLQRAYRRGRQAAEDEEGIPRAVIEGSRDVHAAWLDGYMDGVHLPE
jgi:hypothetical protein